MLTVLLNCTGIDIFSDGTGSTVDEMGVVLDSEGK